jgi:hypothetical protein
MNERAKSSSFFAWFTGAARKRKNTVTSRGYCASCRLPLEKWQALFGSVDRQAYCQVCRSMNEGANTPYLQTVQDKYLEEQKRKKILLTGGNYLS